MLLTRSPLGLPQYCYRMDPARLACVRHAASVRPEPGSNSPSKSSTSAAPSRRTDWERRGPRSLENPRRATKLGTDSTTGSGEIRLLLLLDNRSVGTDRMLSELTTITASWLFIRPEAVVEQSADAVIARTGFFVLSSVFKERPDRGGSKPRLEQNSICSRPRSVREPIRSLCRFTCALPPPKRVGRGLKRRANLVRLAQRSQIPVVTPGTRCPAPFGAAEGYINTAETKCKLRCGLWDVKAVTPAGRRRSQGRRPGPVPARRRPPSAPAGDAPCDPA